MAFRRDVQLDILLTRFQEFDHGEVIEQDMPEKHGLQAGDTLEWDCAQFYGTARVMSVAPSNVPGDVRCCLKKLS